MKAKDKIKILQVHGRMRMGGIETFLMNMLRHIDREKFEFVFLTYTDSDKRHDFEDEIEALGSRIVKIKDNRVLRPLRFIADIKQVIRAEGVDVVHCHSVSSTVHALVAAKHAKVKIRIAHSHNTGLLMSLPPILRSVFQSITRALLLKYANTLLACSQPAGNALFGRKPSFIVMENGIEVDEFKFSEKDRLDVRSELNIQKNTFVMTNIARLSKSKNPLFLVDIFHAYRKKHPDSKLVLVGDGDMRLQVEQHAQSLGIAQHVILAGRRRDANRLYSASDVLVSPSLHEGLMITLIEAQVSGLPCLVSEHVPQDGNITERVSYMSLADTAEEWAKAIETRDTTRQIENYRTVIESNFNVNKAAEKLGKIYSNNRLEGGRNEA